MSCVLAINYLCVWGGGEGRSGIVLRVGQTTKEKNFMVLRVIRDTLLSVPSLSPFQSLRHYRHTLCTKLRTKHTPPLPENAPHAPIFLTREQITKESFKFNRERERKRKRRMRFSLTVKQ